MLQCWVQSLYSCVAVPMKKRLLFLIAASCCCGHSFVAVQSFPVVRGRRRQQQQQRFFVLLMRNAELRIREFAAGDGEEVYNLLLLDHNNKNDDTAAATTSTVTSLSSSSSSSSSFDPEGPLWVDCGTDVAIQESYGNDDGSCFLVAEKNDNGSIVGTAGLVVGTAVSYFKSGTTTLSDPPIITGAIRRVCGLSSSQNDDDVNVLKLLLKEIEQRALKAQVVVHELIILAYPTTNVGHNTRRRPDAKLLQQLGYQRLPGTFGGGNDDNNSFQAVEQYGKQLQAQQSFAQEMSKSTRSMSMDDESEENDAVRGLGEALLAAAVVLLIVSVVGIADWMGLDVTSNSVFFQSTNDNKNDVRIINRGLGSPLTTEELDRLRRDEALQRTDLDGLSTNSNREWQDLTQEEQQEESALMKIIQGKDIRLR